MYAQAAHAKHADFHLPFEDFRDDSKLTTLISILLRRHGTGSTVPLSSVRKNRLGSVVAAFRSFWKNLACLCKSHHVYTFHRYPHLLLTHFYADVVLSKFHSPITQTFTGSTTPSPKHISKLDVEDPTPIPRSKNRAQRFTFYFSPQFHPMSLHCMLMYHFRVDDSFYNQF